MTLPAFFKVILITPSGKSAKVRRLATRNSTSDGGWTGTCVPSDRWYDPDAKIATKRIKNASWDANEPFEYVCICEYFFRPWDGKPAYFDHWD